MTRIGFRFFHIIKHEVRNVEACGTHSVLVEMKAAIEWKVIADRQDKGTKKFSSSMSPDLIRRDRYTLV